MSVTDPLPPCPYLPEIGAVRHPASALVAFRRGRRGPDFYLQALRCAQSKWLERLPGQALLMLNRAMGAELNEEGDHQICGSYPIPYRAVRWVLHHGQEVGFMGNPRRHYQHLATRMSGRNPELRTARAWACWALARKQNPEWEADTLQLSREEITEPSLAAIESSLRGWGGAGEAAEWLAALEDRP